MKNTFAKLLFLLFFSATLFTIKPVKAVVAYPYPIEFTQPDGSKITIILKGDEKVRWAQTLDGYSIMFNKQGTYEYAVINNKGDMNPSGVKVHNAVDRSIEETSFLNTIVKNITYSHSQVSMFKSIWDINENKNVNVFPTTGSRKLICILIGFTDKAFTKTQADFNNLFNQIGYTTDAATGSVKDYYAEASYNQFDLTVDVAGPYIASQNMAYYGAHSGSNNDVNPRALVTEAVNLANPTVNFADYDNDGDGTVDAVYVIYAGYGEEAGASTDAIWAHAWGLYPAVTLDGKSMSKYSCSAELRGNAGTSLTRIGVICHEFGHVLGAPDYYDTDYATGGQYEGTGDWDLMAGGSWNNNGATPAHHNAYTKIYKYNWATATTLSTGTTITLTNAVDNSNSFYRFNTATTNEYYLIENRQQYKFDAALPGHGMIIYHVASTIGISGINATHPQLMYPVCASAITNPSATPSDYGSISSAGCTFPGTSSKTSFTDASTPNALSWAGANTNKPITSITENVGAKTVSFNFMGGSSCTAPTIQATVFTSSSITGTSMTIGWTRGNGNNVLVVAKATTPVDADPSGGTSYTANAAFSSGQQIGLGNYVVYNGTGTSVNITGLSTNTTYYYSVYEYNTLATCYKVPSLNGNATTTCTIISSFPYNEGFEGGVIPTCWNNNYVTGTNAWQYLLGSGASHPAASHTGTKNACLKNASYTADVTKLVTPTLNLSSVTSPTLTFWHTQEVWPSDQDELRVYYKTSSGGAWTLLATYTASIASWTQETITLPSPTADYYIAFEGTAKYGYGVCLDDISVFSSACTAPSLQATVFTSSSITSSTMTIGWTRGNGNNVIVLAKAGSAVNTDPTSGVTYTDNATFASGQQIGTGNYVVYKGTGTSVNVTGLLASTTYYYKIYEYNNTAICFLTPGLSGNASTTAAITSSTFTGTGNWSDVARWSNGIPTSSIDATIAGFATITATANCKALTINEGSGLTCNSGQTLNVANNFLIKSSATGTGLFNDQGATLNITGTKTIQRYLSGNVWHITSSPVTTTTASVYNGIYLKYYDPTIPNFTYINALTDPISVGKGYFAWKATAATINFTGTMNSGTVNIPITNLGDQWNMVGNPYPCNIDWAIGAGWDKTNVSATTMYIYDPSLGSYRSHNGTVGVPGGSSSIIPAGQGFWVKASAIGNLVVNKNALTTTTQSFYKDGAPSYTFRMKAKRSKYDDEMLITFDYAATNNYDENKDAEKLFSSNPDLPQLYSISPTNEKLCINSLASQPNSVTVPLGITSTPGNITFSAFDFNHLEGSIILEDLTLNQLIDLRLQPDYSFTFNTGDDNRFLLHFNQTATSVTKVTSENISIYGYKKGIYINNPTNTAGSVIVYDLIGNVIFAEKLTSGLNKLSVSTIAASYVIVKVICGETVLTRKVVINN